MANTEICLLSLDLLTKSWPFLLRKCLLHRRRKRGTGGGGQARPCLNNFRGGGGSTLQMEIIPTKNNLYHTSLGASLKRNNLLFFSGKFLCLIVAFTLKGLLTKEAKRKSQELFPLIKISEKIWRRTSISITRIYVVILFLKYIYMYFCQY